MSPRTRLKVELSTSSLSRLPRNLGLSAQRPVYQAYRKDPARAAEYLNTTFPLGLGGKTPVVRDTGGRFGINLISAVSPRGDLRFSVIGETMDSDRFIGGGLASVQRACITSQPTRG